MSLGRFRSIQSDAAWKLNKNCGKTDQSHCLAKYAVISANGQEVIGDRRMKFTEHKARQKVSDLSAADQKSTDDEHGITAGENRHQNAD